MYHEVWSVIRVELVPKYWQATRSNLNPVELEADLCSFTIPPAALNFAR